MASMAPVPGADVLGEPKRVPEDEETERIAANHPDRKNGSPNSCKATLLRTQQIVGSVLHKAGGDQGGIRKKQSRKRHKQALYKLNNNKYVQ